MMNKKIGDIAAVICGIIIAVIGMLLGAMAALLGAGTLFGIFIGIVISFFGVLLVLYPYKEKKREAALIDSESSLGRKIRHKLDQEKDKLRKKANKQHTLKYELWVRPSLISGMILLMITALDICGGMLSINETDGYKWSAVVFFNIIWLIIFLYHLSGSRYKKAVEGCRAVLEMKLVPPSEAHIYAEAAESEIKGKMRFSCGGNRLFLGESCIIYADTFKVTVIHRQSILWAYIMRKASDRKDLLTGGQEYCYAVAALSTGKRYTFMCEEAAAELFMDEMSENGIITGWSSELEAMYKSSVTVFEERAKDMTLPPKYSCKKTT